MNFTLGLITVTAIAFAVWKNASYKVAKKRIESLDSQYLKLKRDSEVICHEQNEKIRVLEGMLDNYRAIREDLEEQLSIQKNMVISKDDRIKKLTKKQKANDSGN